MKFYLDEMLADVDASQIPITDNHPLSLDRIMKKTISGCNAFPPISTQRRMGFRLSLAAAILAGLVVTTALAATVSDSYMQTVTVTYPVSEDGQILPHKASDPGITLSVSDISPTGLCLTGSIETTKPGGAVYAVGGYFLEVQTDGLWQTVPLLYAHHWQWEPQRIDGSQHTWQIDWTAIYGELPPGCYRIQKYFAVAESEEEEITQSSQCYFVGAVFIIEDATPDSE